MSAEAMFNNAAPHFCGYSKLHVLVDAGCTMLLVFELTAYAALRRIR
jgi:hypothetical protein